MCQFSIRAFYPLKMRLVVRPLLPESQVVPLKLETVPNDNPVKQQAVITQSGECTHCLSMALAHGMQIYVMATGGSVMADTEASSLALSIPEEMRLGGWACQDMLTVDIAPNKGMRSQDGYHYALDTPGLGFAPDENLLGNAVAVYEAD